MWDAGIPFSIILEKQLNLNIWGIDSPEGYCHQEEFKNVDFLMDFLEFNNF